MGLRGLEEGGGRRKGEKARRGVECSETQKIIDVGLFTKFGQWRLGAKYNLI